MTERETYSAKQLARVMGISDRQLRKFFRTRTSSDLPVGRGHQYEFKADEVDRIKAEYRHWRQRIEEKERERKAVNRVVEGLRPRSRGKDMGKP